jgi:acyl carrier protein
LEAAYPSERQALLTAHVQETVAQILGMTNVPSAKVGFNEFGMDSLMALELRRRLERSLRLALPATVAFEYPTSERLVEFLLAEGLAELAESRSNPERNRTYELATPPKLEIESASAPGDALEAELSKLEQLLKG